MIYHATLQGHAAQIAQAGPDALDEWQLNYLAPFKWLAHWYKREDYEGVGVLAYEDINGNFWWLDLGHCSCYGPTDPDSKKPEPVANFDALLHICRYDDTFTDRLRLTSDYDYERWEGLKRAIQQIVGGA